MGDFLYISGMKDLSEYIRTLIDEVNIPLEIRLQEDGVYNIVTTKDLKESWVFYMCANERAESDIRFIRVQLKKYLPQLEFVVKVNYINYPKSLKKMPIKHEYVIKPRR
jgi:hypothetical protein